MSENHRRLPIGCDDAMCGRGGCENRHYVELSDFNASSTRRLRVFTVANCAPEVREFGRRDESGDETVGQLWLGSEARDVLAQIIKDEELR